MDVMNSTEITGAILCGGRSSRMGRDKALLRLGKRTLLEIVADKLSHVCDHIMLVADASDKYSDLGMTAVCDIVPRTGPLGGILTALDAAVTYYIFVVACDMPFLNMRLMQFMRNNINGADVVVPCLGMRYEPLLAIYSKRCIEPIRQLIDDGQLRITALYDMVKTKVIGEEMVRRFDPQALSFFNINTMEDYERARNYYDSLSP